MGEMMRDALIQRTKEAIASIPAIIVTLGIMYACLRIINAILIPHVLGY
jgi:hypothetical protein